MLFLLVSVKFPQIAKKSTRNLPKSILKRSTIHPKTLPNRGLDGIALRIAFGTPFPLRLEASCAVLRGSWNRLGAVLGRPGGRLGAILGNLGDVLGVSWGVLGASWGLLAAKTQQERGRAVFWSPLRAVLASFLTDFERFFKITFQ